MFWPKRNSKKICKKTNLYAKKELEVEGENIEITI
jgi:hypothetical protein